MNFIDNQICNRFTEIYEEYSDVILEKSFKMINDYHEAENIMQETFFRLYKNLPKYKSDKQIKKLLYITSYKLSLNHNNRLKRQGLDIGDVNYLKAFVEEKQRELDPEKIHLYNDFEVRILKRILKLKEPYKGVLTCLEIYKMTSDEVCKKYGINYNLLRVRVFRAKEVIRDKFCNEIEEFYG